MASSSSDQDRRSYIITHMNADHKRELSHFLRHYTSLPPSATLPASACSLTDVHLKHGLTIRAPSGKDYHVPFDPPEELPSWAGVRDRVIGMDRIARAAMGISDVYITEYVPPRGLLGWMPPVGVLIYFAIAATLPLWRPGSAAWDLLDAVGLRWFVEVMAAPIAAIHVSEALAFDRLRMHRHGVERWSSLWWKWELDILVQGVFAWRKFDAIVKEKSKKGESKSH